MHVMIHNRTRCLYQFCNYTKLIVYTLDIRSYMNEHIIAQLCSLFKCDEKDISMEMEYHQRQETVQPWMKSAKQMHIFWNSPHSKDGDIDNRIQLLFHPSSSDGIIACICGSFNTTTDSKQTRSGDESMTVFVTCKDCGHAFRM